MIYHLTLRPSNRDWNFASVTMGGVPVEPTGGSGVARRARRSSDLFFWPGHSRLDYLTNSFESRFELDKKTFRSVAWYMWYRRAKLWRPTTDLSVLVLEAKTQEEAKQLSRRCTDASSSLMRNWNDVRLRIMAEALVRKFQSSVELASRLLQTGEDRLLYASRYDAYYGIGFTMHEAADRSDEWGHNYLGQMLMIVRKRLQEGSIK